MKGRTHVLASLFSFFIAFSIFIGVFVVVTKITLMNQNYLFHVLNQVDYYDEIADELNQNFMQSAGGVGLEPEIYKDFISGQEVKQVSMQYIQSNFIQSNDLINNENFKVRLRHYLYDVVDISDEDEKRLDTYIDFNAQIYQQYLLFPFIQYFMMAFEMFDKVIPFVLMACLFIGVVAVIFLRHLKLQQRWQSFYTSNVCFASALLISMIPIVILMSKLIRRIHLSPECYYRFMVSYFEGYLWVLGICGLILFVLGIVLGFVQKYIRYKMS